MKRLGTLLALLILSGCTFNTFNPDRKIVIISPHCEAINGDYRLNFDEFYHYNKAGFWQLRQYDKFKIKITEQHALFVGEREEKPIATLNLGRDKWSCSNGVLSIDIENVVQNNGGVSVYQSRSLALYSYQPEKVIIQFKELSSGLAFLIPVSAGEDSRVVLTSVENTP